MTAGIGIGAGLAMGQQFVAGLSRSSQAQEQPAKLSPQELKTKLQQLKELLESGLINQADFDEQKKRLLAQM